MTTRTGCGTLIRTALALGVCACVPPEGDAGACDEVGTTGLAPGSTGTQGGGPATTGGRVSEGDSDGDGHDVDDPDDDATTEGRLELLWEGHQANYNGTLALDEAHLYFGTTQGLNRVRKDGGELTALVEGPRIGAVAVNAERVFWYDVDDATVEASDKNGSNRLVIEANVTGVIHRIQADESFVYWSGGLHEQAGLFRATVDAGSKTTLRAGNWMSFVLRGSTIFGYEDAGVSRIESDGSGYQRIASGLHGGRGVFADTTVFWGTNCVGGDGRCNQTWRVDLDGSNAEVINPFVASHGYVADSSHLYFVANGHLFRSHRDGASAVSVRAGVWGLLGESLLMDENALYWMAGDGLGNCALYRLAWE